MEIPQGVRKTIKNPIRGLARAAFSFGGFISRLIFPACPYSFSQRASTGSSRL